MAQGQIQVGPRPGGYGRGRGGLPRLGRIGPPEFVNHPRQQRVLPPGSVTHPAQTAVAPQSATGTVPGSATAPHPATTPGATPPSPLDSTYYANVAANQFRTNNEINGLNLQGERAGTALQSALAQLAYQQPRQQLQLEQGANRAGNLYSTVYDQNLGNLNYQFAGRQGAAQNNYTNQIAQLASRIAGLQGGVPIYNLQQALAASNRASAQAAANPGTGQTPAVPIGGSGAGSGGARQILGGGVESHGPGFRGLETVSHTAQTRTGGRGRGGRGVEYVNHARQQLARAMVRQHGGGY